MLDSKEKDIIHHKYLKNYLKSKPFQRLLIGLLTIVIAFIIVNNGAAPKKYKLSLGDKSQYDINAPRDIENTLKTEENRQAAVSTVEPVTKEISSASIEVLTSANDFFTMIESARKSAEKNLQNQGVSKNDSNYKQKLLDEQEKVALALAREIRSIGVPLSGEQVRYLLTKSSDDDLISFKKITMDLLSVTMKDDITQDDLAKEIDDVQNQFQNQQLDQDLKNIGGLLVRAILKPNRTIDTELTESNRKKAYDDPKNIEKILKDQRIISVGEIVTNDKLKILEDLNYLETTSRFDFVFAAGILSVLLLLALLLVLYMNQFCKQALYSKNDLLIICIMIILSLLIARGVYEYSALAIPIFIAAMSISIMLDLKLALAVNFVLTIAISLITKGDLQFIYMSLISGSFSAFIVSGATQRSKLSMTGVFVGIVNVLIIICIGIINKSGITAIARDSIVVFLNGVASAILTVGMLPIWESLFNIITPLKLLELTNPNQPLLKRLLMEAPGTYHHSLMVGNLAEVATEAIGGNSLLARVGAYFHDIGKLKRPYFFKENQMTDNPHDRMTANLSTLVITSHTRDGVEIAEKSKIPMAIKEIISQHHGTTLVAYFYHKAKKGEKGESVKQENFRYEGPKPSTKEAAVVMLADSVEAAVRSMIDKTEGKIEGLVRKIIKDKLDDGQLDLCNLTLKDLDTIAKAFMRVLSGVFHAREEYPEIKIKPKGIEEAKIADSIIKETVEQKQDTEEGEFADGDFDREFAD